MSLLLAPPASHPTTHTQTTSAPSAPGVPDTLRNRLALTTPASTNTSTAPTADLASSHPLESRLARWRAVQDATKFTMLARQYGVAEPVRRRMELADCAMGEWRPAVLGGEGRSHGGSWGSGGVTGAGVHADVLLGRETEIAWEDVFVGRELGREIGFHTEVEGRVGMGSW
ncbi:hypothetical protein K461DRAFT_241548 [Myriangium duriaei CBS 260.36]|uniref:Uncharacterized protein n=1 Tax=Myriangium duriaei CBS 260.36 TaxID=1168546 RepID=A0A9P4J1J4_9PEZI|nr:hypothetical protein K461DRAFT_241548 [Myriangium duriaei CBS 260.36]